MNLHLNWVTRRPDLKKTTILNVDTWFRIKWHKNFKTSLRMFNFRKLFQARVFHQIRFIKKQDFEVEKTERKILKIEIYLVSSLFLFFCKAWSVISWCFHNCFDFFFSEDNNWNQKSSNLSTYTQQTFNETRYQKQYT